MSRTWLTVSLLLLPAVIHADPSKIPDPALCTVPTLIRVVGTSGGVPDNSGAFVVTIRDIGNNPNPSAQVALDFSACPDLKLGVPGPNTYLDCASHALWTITNTQGEAYFCVSGAGTNLGASPGAGALACTIFADGVIIGHATVVIYDQDGAVTMPGMEVTDLGAMLKDLGSGAYFGRSDFDGDGTLGVADLSRMLTVMGTGASSQGDAPYCP
ncbi:MAG TPA: hypothetical protein VFK69_13820 [Candidatus Eisenbacteria bacterium]|nr:hypothetical protein [Candidatus Eisenbacteria bacterium]